MTGGTPIYTLNVGRVRDIGAGEGVPPAPSGELPPPPSASIVMEDETADLASGRGPALMAGSCIAGAALWLILGVAIAWNGLAALSGIALVEFAGALALGPVLAALLYLLGLRTSRAEARRFGATAREMRAEAVALERQVARLSDALEANRVRLDEQSRALVAIGDDTTARLGGIADQMAGGVARAAAQASALAGAGSTAHDALTTLLAALPRAQAGAEEATRQLDLAALVVDEHVRQLEAAMGALSERSREADDSTVAAAARLATHLDAIRDGGADFDARLGSTETMVERIGARIGDHRAASEALVERMSGAIADIDARMDALERQGVERVQLLAASISALGTSTDAMTESLRIGDGMATQTISTAESLLIALDAATREIDETLPEALGRLDARIGQSKAVVVQAKPELLALVSAAESTHGAIEAIAGVIADQRRTLDQLSAALISTLDEGRSKADEVGAMVEETIGRTHRFAEDAAPRLIEVLLRVRETATAAADRARETLAAVIPEAARELETASGDAIRRATSNSVERHVRALGDAADEAAGAAARAGERLARRIAELGEQTAALDARVESAQERMGLSRRVAVLIEALNSHAIDIAKSFSADVADSAWAAYLKGDRGVFTRRAVRILEASQVAAIVRAYDHDAEIRDQINRYIHDFEAMLRLVLAQREGSALGVTLLSSDMGKLYVVLAQAIERLN